MRQAIVNGRWNLWLPDSVADWDAITGDYSARKGWEFERFEALQQMVHYGDVFFDVGAEHGWISAVLGREFVGAENMVLFEPSPEFWPNIYKTWKYNGLNEPVGMVQAFVGAKTDWAPSQGDLMNWPAAIGPVEGPECEAMAYRSLRFHTETIPTIALDDFVRRTGIEPTVINIDVEGAEMEVLIGADKILDTNQPLVFVSIHPDLMLDFHTNPEELQAYMAARDYVGHFLGRDHEEHWVFHPRNAPHHG